MLEHDARASEIVDAQADATHGRTHERTDVDEVTTSENSPSVSPAGGQDESDGQHTEHAHSPHVYIIYWPEIATVKVGITGVGNGRWDWWLRRGGVLIGITETCCMEHARTMERALLDDLADFGAPAFKSEQAARHVLGKNRGGYTECFRLVQSPRFGEPLRNEYDWEHGYGLLLPRCFEETFKFYDFIRLPVSDAWREDAA